MSSRLHTACVLGHLLFTFKNARRSAFHLSARRRLISFGNYPIPIKVRGRFVACNRTETKFLITYGSAAGLGLACLTTRSDPPWKVI